MAGAPGQRWLFLSNHGTVLLCVAGDPTLGVDEIARLVGAERSAVEEVLGDLLSEGYLVQERSSGRDRYEINRHARLRHPLFGNVEIGPLIDALGNDDERREDRRAP